MFRKKKGMKSNPTSTDWEERVDKAFGFYLTEISLREIKSFISSLLKEERKKLMEEIKQKMIDKIYYIGNELPQATQNKQSKFVLLGTPQDFLNSLEKE